MRFGTLSIALLLSTCIFAGAESNNIRKGARKLRKLTKDDDCIGKGRFQYIVTCKHDEEDACLEELIEAGIELVHIMPDSDYFSVCADNLDEIQKLMELADVEDLEPDPVRTLDYMAGSATPRELRGQQETTYGLDLVKAPEFWGEYGKRGDGITVCVIDTGLLVGHEDIKDASLDGSNDEDIAIPWNDDGHGHGTHVAGTIAAVDNDVGVIGVSPDASIFVARVFDGNGQFAASGLIDALLDCERGESDVINMSLGGPDTSTVEQNEIKRLTEKGILIIAAAGNSGHLENPVEYPAGYDDVMSVGALDRNKHIAYFSTFNNHVDVTAPGVDVLSMTVESTSSYAAWNGTSMAAPHVAGVAALLKSEFPEKSGAEIRTAIEKTAEDVGACGLDRIHGNGLVNSMAAAEYLKGTGGDAPEQSGCVDVSITIKTDERASQTSYKVLDKTTREEIYKGGRYEDGQQITMVDSIKLPPGCYEFIIEDSWCDGANNPQLGIGEYTVSYGCNDEIFITNFAGCEETATFGDCGTGSDSSTGDGCSEGGNTGGDSTGTGDTNEGSETDGNVDEGAAPSKPVAGESGSCSDNPPGWYDADGEDYDCAWYAEGSNCFDYGDLYENNGKTANSACCACGGGVISSSCVDAASGWHDSDGSDYDCEWYAQGTNCDDYGDLYPDKNGMTANIVCCACGGGDSNNNAGEGGSNGEGSDSGSDTPCKEWEHFVELNVTTDEYGDEENQLFFFDTYAPVEENIWIYLEGDFESDEIYTMQTCVDANGCYQLFFFDSWGDGLLSGGLTMSIDGRTVYTVTAGDAGENFPTGGVYYSKDIGFCSGWD